MSSSNEVNSSSIIIHSSPSRHNEDSSPSSSQDGSRTDLYAKDGPLGLVPIFLVGATGIVLLYIIGHCLYIHCYARRQMRNIARSSMSNKSQSEYQQHQMVLSNGVSNSNPLQPFTAMVRYDPGETYGRNELVEVQPFLVRQKPHPALKIANSDDGVANLDKPSTSRVSNPGTVANFAKSPKEKRQKLGGDEKNSNSSSRIGSFVKRKGTGIGKEREAEKGGGGGEGLSIAGMLPENSSSGGRATICFVPIGAGFVDAKDNDIEWTPLQGYVCSL